MLDLEAIKKRAAEATPGPWEAFDAVPGAVAYAAEDGLRPANLFGLDIDGYAICSHRPDADFIAHARTDIPALLDRIAALERVAELCLPVAGTWPKMKQALRAAGFEVGDG